MMAIFLESCNPRKKAIMPETIIVRTEIIKLVGVIEFSMSFIAAAEPVRVFPIAYTVAKLKPMIIVFIAPTRKRKLRLSCLIISEPITAACPDPMPGRKEQRGAAIEAAKEDFSKLLKGSFIFLRGVICCGGREILFLKLTIREETPKRPVRRGRRGSLIGRLNVIKPRKPESANTIIEERISFSRKIRKRETHIKINGMRIFIAL